MRSGDERTGPLFSYVDLEARVGVDHPLRTIRSLENEALAALSPESSMMYSRLSRSPIPPEELRRAMLLQAFYLIRSERLLMEPLEFDLLFAGSSAQASMMRRGITRHSRGTAIAYWKATSRRSSWLPCSNSPK